MDYVVLPEYMLPVITCNQPALVSSAAAAVGELGSATVAMMGAVDHQAFLTKR
jgi:hypothetical protein